ncbi:MAG: hypothetical protein E7570_05340 [Ruminococcaceae bacterium]|nr:hypothetical protein [Oscillospiraceae bacterium]
MRKMKKYLSILLSLILLISPLNTLTAMADSYVASITDGETTEYYESIDSALNKNNWSAGSTLTLLSDVEVSFMVVMGDGEHTLDLNGYGIRSTISAGEYYKKLFYINGETCSLTVTDSGSREHKYTVNANGLAAVNDGLEGTKGVDYFTFNGGYITNSPDSVFYNTGNLTINAGTIIGNYTDSNGAAVYSEGNLNLNGGKIIYNTANSNGGGVYLNNGNTARVSGNPVISDNKPNNLFVSNDAEIKIAGELGNSASIGVKMQGNTGVLTSSDNTSYNDASKFFSDSSLYVVGKDALSNQLKIHAPYTITWQNYDGTVLETDSDVAEGTVPTYNGEAPTKQGAFSFEGWSPDVTAATGNATYTATFTGLDPVARVGETYYESLDDAVNSWTAGSTLTLLKDIDVTQAINVPSGAHTIDLNGFGIRAAGSRNFSILSIPSDASLTMNDSGSTVHKYTVGANCVASVDDSLEGTEGVDYFTFTGGYITGVNNTSISGGAVSNLGTFTMNGGTLIGNNVNKGAGICNYGTTNFNGGLITGNCAVGWGGGIYLSDTGANTVNILGGVIRNNGAGNGGGVHISDYDRVNISGSPIITDNISINDNPEVTANNLNLALYANVAITGPLGEDALIGLRRSSGYGVITDSENTEYNDIDKFTSDNATYVVGKDASSNQLKLHTPYTVTWLNDNDEVLETDTNVAEGTVPTYDGELPSKSGDSQKLYAFESWSPEVTAATGDATYTATYTQMTPVARIGDTLYGSFEEAVKAENWVAGSTLTLLADIEVTGTVNIPEGALADPRTIDLNGFGIRAAGSRDYNIFTVSSNAKFIMNDSGSTVHRYTVDENGLAIVDDSIGGIEGEDYQTFTGGYLTGVYGVSHAPSTISNSGIFTMNGGTIIGNYTERSGAGIGCSSSTRINGGQIIYNVANNWGGGVYASTNYVEVNLTGGLIAHNKCGNNGGGIHISAGSQLHLWGNPVVRDNYKNDALNNVNLANDGLVFVEEALDNSASIGIRKSSNTGVFTNSVNTAYNNASNFVSDNSSYVVAKDVSTNQLKLHAPYTVTWQNYDGTVLETDSNLTEGDVPTYDGATPVRPDDSEYSYEFEGWTPAVTAATGDTAYTAAFTAIPRPVAEVDGVQYTSFDDAAEASGGTKNIILLRDMSEYSMNDLTSNIGLLRVKANGNDENVVDYQRSESVNNISFYYRDDSNVYIDGEGSDDDSFNIAAGAAASVVVAGGASVSIVLGAGASVSVSGGGSVSVDVSDSDSECLEEQENEDGSKEYKNHKFHWVTIDTGISILDAGAEVLPDCVNDIWATYNQNVATIVKILPPVLTIIGYTDIILKFPYPEGWYFPPIPYLPESMNPGAHFVAFFEGAGYDTYGTPFLGKNITEDLEITGVWVPYEAAVEKPNGDHIDYYLSFADAADERGGNDNIVRILSAPLFNYTLKKIEDDPAVYEVLKVKRGFYMGTCVEAPSNLPEGYAMRSWTYEDEEGETVTCYTIDGHGTEDAYNLTLDDCIHMNLYLHISDADSASVTITHNDPDKQAPTTVTETYSGSELKALKDDEDGRYVFKILAAPAQMRDEITVEVNDGEDSRTFKTSIKDYCEAVIERYEDSSDTKEEQLVELAKSMLDYGKACSEEFSYNEGAFSSQDYINSASVTIPGVIQLEGKSGIFKSYSYVAKSIPVFRVYINKTEAQCVQDGLVATVTDANGNVREIAPTVVEGTDKVCFDITGILAENLNETNVIEYDGATLTINANQYAKAKGGNFGRSMFNYGVAAHNYFKD